jgi:hypothetical protein
VINVVSAKQDFYARRTVFLTRDNHFLITRNLQYVRQIKIVGKFNS